MMPPVVPSLPLSGDPVASFLARSGRSSQRGGGDSPPRGSCAAARAAAAAASASASSTAASLSAAAATVQFEPTIGSAQTSSSSSGSQRALPASQSPSPPRDTTQSARASRSQSQRASTSAAASEAARGAPYGVSPDAPIELPDTVPYVESLGDEELVPAATSSEQASVASASASASPSAFVSALSSSQHAVAVVPGSPPRVASRCRIALSPPVAPPGPSVSDVAVARQQPEEHTAVTMSSARRGRGIRAARTASPEAHVPSGGQSRGPDDSPSPWLSTVKPPTPALSESASVASAALAAATEATASSAASRSVAAASRSAQSAGAAAASLSPASESSTRPSDRRVSSRLAQKRDRRGDTGVSGSKGRYGKRSGRRDFVDSGSDDSE